MAASKSNPAMEFIVESLNSNRSAAYKDIAEAAATLNVCTNVMLFFDVSGFPYQIKVNDINPEVGSSTLEASNGHATKLDGVLMPPTFSSLQV